MMLGLKEKRCYQEKIEMNTKFLNAIKSLYSRLYSSNIIWAITGSFGQVLQGVTLKPNDIDILTNQNGAYSIEKLFSDCIIQKVTFKERKNIRSYFGILNINDVKIEIIGDVENKINGIWESHCEWEKHINYLMFEDVTIPVISLEYEYKIYNKLKNINRTVLIKKALRH